MNETISAITFGPGRFLPASTIWRSGAAYRARWMVWLFPSSPSTFLLPYSPPEADLRHSLGAQDSSVRSPSDGQSHGSISTDPDLPSAAQQRVVENAKIHGVAKVFGDDLCGAVRRVEEGSRAAVTMAFPLWGGPVQCLMSLDICEPHVERLAMALFGAKVKWVGQVLHVVLEQGTTLITPNSEATLKGIGDERIARVLGTEIYGAIRECPVHVREIAEGKRATECVSMIFTKGGAFINLSLGLERSLQLQNKMYM